METKRKSRLLFIRKYVKPCTKALEDGRYSEARITLKALEVVIENMIKEERDEEINEIKIEKVTINYGLHNVN